jgi:S1-C subfamily serine protease
MLVKMRMVAVIAALMTALSANLGFAADDQVDQSIEAPVQKIKQMLYPTVMVDLRQGQGSGTVIFSGVRPHPSWKDEKIWSLVLTNWHVISSAISITEEFDPIKGKEVKKETRAPVHVRFWDYNDYSTAVGTTGRTAKIVAWDKARDLALLRIDDKERKLENVGSLWPDDVGGPYLFQTIWAVGSGLGNPPYPTEGLLSGISGRDVNGRLMYLSSAPIIFGNSGGSLWAYSKARNRYELIGVPTAISASGWGKIVSHMAWSRPINEIRVFLRNNRFGFVLGDEDEPKLEKKDEDEKGDKKS